MTKITSKIPIKNLLSISFLLPVLIIVILETINIYQNNKETNSKINNAKALKQYYDLLPLAHKVIQHLQSEREYSFFYLESVGVKNLEVTKKIQMPI